MSDYTKSTNFTSKDSLVSGNPLKIVKGTELDTEFNNISTAIATKADLASPALTGTPTAPTAAEGTSSTQVATTAFAMKAAYPVGSVYMNASDSTNPATLFGFGTWVALGEGKVLIGYKSGDALFGTAGNTGGSADAVVVSHTHTASVTDPGHKHTFTTNSTGSGAGDSTTAAYSGLSSASITRTPDTSTATTGISVSNSTTGVSATNANLPPYLVVYMWKRTA
jgi:hypothetical protein